jgi:hypothetical protein
MPDPADPAEATAPPELPCEPDPTGDAELATGDPEAAPDVLFGCEVAPADPACVSAPGPLEPIEPVQPANSTDARKQRLKPLRMGTSPRGTGARWNGHLVRARLSLSFFRHEVTKTQLA